MNDRERIIELLVKANLDSSDDEIWLADHLIANGVTIQKHGRWEKASEMMPIYRCSVCKERNLFKNGDNVFSNYCPNCGAKMDLEA